MKILKLLSVITFFFLFLNAKSQVKIGNNPGSINVNSILELESGNKGFLPPRVALSSVNSPTPLTASTPAGMLVYSSGGLLSDGYYTWNGSKWLMLNAGGSDRVNHVLVKSAADLPAPVGGVITLSAGTLYEINGSITVSDKINLNGCNINGADPVNDKITYNGSGELFTGNGTGGIRLLTISAPAGKIFNINGGAVASKNLLVQNCYFIGCNEIGTIQNVGGTVFFSNVAYFYNSTGITFQNDHNVVLSQCLWDITNASTYETFVGSFNIIQILGGDRLVSSANSAIAENVSGITSINAGSIKVVMFVGSGTYVSGAFNNAWEIEASGLNTEKDDVASGNLYLSTASTTSFTGMNAAKKVSGTTIATSLFRVTSPANNRLTYSGAKSKRFQVICSLTATPTSNNNLYYFYIAKNGVVLPESKQAVRMANTSDQQSVTVSCSVLLAPYDYIELWSENASNSGSVLISTFNMAAK